GTPAGPPAGTGGRGWRRSVAWSSARWWHHWSLDAAQSGGEGARPGGFHHTTAVGVLPRPGPGVRRRAWSGGGRRRPPQPTAARTGTASRAVSAIDPGHTPATSVTATHRASAMPAATGTRRRGAPSSVGSLM